MNTNPTLLVLAADIAAWLAEHDSPDLPRLCHLSIPAPRRIPSSPSIQIAGSDAPLTTLADWAEVLGITPEIRDVDNGYLSAEIVTVTRGSNPFKLWLHLSCDSRRALETVKTPFARNTSQRVAVPVLRQAAEKAGEW